MMYFFSICVIVIITIFHYTSSHHQPDKLPLAYNFKANNGHWIFVPHTTNEDLIITTNEKLSRNDGKIFYDDKLLRDEDTQAADFSRENYIPDWLVDKAGKPNHLTDDNMLGLSDDSNELAQALKGNGYDVINLAVDGESDESEASGEDIVKALTKLTSNTESTPDRFSKLFKSLPKKYENMPYHHHNNKNLKVLSVGPQGESVSVSDEFP